MPNLLATASSPYLLEHKWDPVHWQQWGPEAFDQARQADKPVLLSIGSLSSHQCQTMRRESYQDPVTAAFLNEQFVCILVDGDERPDINLVHQTAVQLFGAPGGEWPLTMFLTAGGIPFGGGTYFPPERRGGTLAFREVLAEILRVARDGRDQADRNTFAVQDRWSQLFAQERPWVPPTAAALERAAMAVCQEFDIFYGGVPGAPKPYNVPAIEMLWRAYCRSLLRQFSRATELSLTGICQGGTYDHLAGGFARESRDELWFSPRFEKTLSGNAQLIELLSLVSQGSANPLYRERVEDTVSWALREMTTASGAFAASLSADSAAVDGGYYTWTVEEIGEVLGDDAALFRQIYDVRAEGNWNGRNILHRLSSSKVLDKPTEDKLRVARSRLLVRRLERERPRRDEKILAEWNGLMICALVAASTTFDRPDWQAAAVKAFWAVADNLDSEGQLSHSWFGGAKAVPGFAADYAQMARAAIALYEAIGHAPYLDRAKAWVQKLETEFWFDPAGGFAMSAENLIGGAGRLRSVLDLQTPNANGVLIGVLGRLFYLTRIERYATRAQALLATFFQDALAQPRAAAAYFNGVDFILSSEQIVIVGSLTDPAVTNLRKVVTRLSLPNKIVTIVPSGDVLPESHPAWGKGQVNQRATAYVCGARGCSDPITEPRLLELRLKTVETNPVIVR